MRILVLCDDIYHVGETVREGLLPLEGDGVSFVFCKDGQGLTNQGLASYELVLLSKSDQRSMGDESPWLTEESLDALETYVGEGGGLLAVHSGTCYDGNERMERLLGGVFLTHPKQCPVTLTPCGEDELTAGVSPFTVTDEFYTMRLSDSQVKIHATLESEHGSQPAVWTKRVGFGRVCCITPAHNPKSWNIPAFARLLENAVRFCTKPVGTALVTGAGRGLGFSLTEALLRHNWQVVAGEYDPNVSFLPKLSKEFEGRLWVTPLDVTSPQSLQAAKAFTARTAGTLDLLISNAGVYGRHEDDSYEEGLYPDEMLRDYQVNALGPVLLMEAFAPLMEKSGCRRICVVSSEAGSIGACWRQNAFGYSMSKAAVNMGVQIWFHCLRPKGYTFRLYHPGYLRTYMLGEKNLKADLEPEEGARLALGYFLFDLPDEDTLTLHSFDGREYPW